MINCSMFFFLARYDDCGDGRGVAGLGFDDALALEREVERF